MRLLPVLILASFAIGAPPDREPETIDYSRPDRYLSIPASAGRVKKLRDAAREMKHENADRTIRNVHAFVASRVPHVPERSWRPDHQDVPELVLLNEL